MAKKKTSDKTSASRDKRSQTPLLDSAQDSGSGTTPWGGRFEQTPSRLLQEFGASLPFDWRLWQEDIEGSIAHALMLAEKGLLSEDELEAIVEGLHAIDEEIAAGTFKLDIADEDIHMAIEKELTRRIGEPGKKLHTARSRNDQVACDLRLWSRAAAGYLISQSENLIGALETRAVEHEDAILPGYTHMQKAQPVLLADHLRAYCEMFKRDITRMIVAFGAANINVLGSGALAGTTYDIDRAMTAEILQFDEVAPSTMDGVSDRDFALDLLYACAVCQMHMSRLCEELILWSTEEFGFVTFSDAYATGSSIMPQKKNPDFAELIRGKTGRVYGNLMALLVTLKGLPLAYNKDMQEDKEPLFDSVDTTGDCLEVLAGIIDTVTFNTDAMRTAAAGGFMAATDLADYLVGKGMAFRDAHEVVGKLVLECEKAGRKLQELTVKELKAVSELFEADVFDLIDIDTMVRRRSRQSTEDAST